MAGAADYVKQATAQYDPTYNTKVNNLKNTLASNLAGYDQQKVAANSTYDKQVDSQNVNNQLAQNTYDNQMTKRGLDFSTIASSGMSGLQDKNTRLVGNINTDRTNYIAGIDQAVAGANVNYNNQLNTMASDRDSQIQTLAQSLYDSEWQKQFQQQQLAQQMTIAKLNAAPSASQTASTQAATDSAALDRKAMDSVYNSGEFGTDSTKKLEALQAQAAKMQTTSGASYALDVLNKYKSYLASYKAPAAKQPVASNPTRLSNAATSGTAYQNYLYQLTGK